MVKISKYGRFFAVYLDDELIAVTVYKKGAERIKKLIEEMKGKETQ